MIRYIHIGGQILEGNNDFAFWDTVSDSFVEFANEQVFDSIEEFKECYNLDSHEDINLDGSRRPLKRYLSLIPVNSK